MTFAFRGPIERKYGKDPYTHPTDEKYGSPSSIEAKKASWECLQAHTFAFVQYIWRTFDRLSVPYITMEKFRAMS